MLPFSLKNGETLQKSTGCLVFSPDPLARRTLEDVLSNIPHHIGPPVLVLQITIYSSATRMDE